MSTKLHQNLSPKTLKRLLNIYAPYLGAGVKVENVNDDWKTVRVSMTLRWYNKNIVGTHFGGSLYSMVDPHFMLMLMKLLGDNYVIWDKSATIDFIRPGKGRVHALFEITDDILETIIEQVEIKDRYLPEFKVKVMDENNKTVARIKKILYVRKKSGPSA